MYQSLLCALSVLIHLSHMRLVCYQLHFTDDEIEAQEKWLGKVTKLGNGKLRIRTLMPSSPSLQPLQLSLSASYGKLPTTSMLTNTLHTFFLTDSTVGAWEPYYKHVFDLSRPSRLARMFHAFQLTESLYSEVRHRDVALSSYLPPQSWGSALTFFCFLLTWVRAWPSST